MLVGQTDSGPALLSGPGLAQTKIGEFVGPRLAQPFWAESDPVSWASPAHIIFYIIYYICFIYICKIFFKKYSEKSLKNIVDFPAYFY